MSDEEQVFLSTWFHDTHTANLKTLLALNNWQQSEDGSPALSNSTRFYHFHFAENIPLDTHPSNNSINISCLDFTVSLTALFDMPILL